MMILGHLMQNSPHWQNIEICLKMVVPNQQALEDAQDNLRDIITRFRLQFKQKVIVAHGEKFCDILKRESSTKDMVMLGLKIPDNDFYNYYEKFKADTKDIPRKIFVLAAQDIEFTDVLN